MYWAQDLPRFGGLDRWSVFYDVDLERECEVGKYAVWKFKLSRKRCNLDHAIVLPHLTHDAEGENNSDAFWRRLALLETIGLIEDWIFSAYDAEDTLLFPLSTFSDNAEAIENKIGDAAHAASMRLLQKLPSYQRNPLDEEWNLFPLLSHMHGIQVSGVPRLRYRAHTSKTAAWQADLHEHGHEYARLFESMAAGEDVGLIQLTRRKA
jgi:hypothetical protein